MINILKRFKIQAAVVALCGLTWVFCPWFAQFKPVSGDTCSCESCVCDTVPDNENCCCEKCDCDHNHDDNCGCPACVPVE